MKIRKVGDLCRNCGTPVFRKDRKQNKRIKDGQEYYFKYILQCPACHYIYMTEDAKVFVKTAKNLKLPELTILGNNLGAIVET
jgi:uncharacterized protein with PIN domain